MVPKILALFLVIGLSSGLTIQDSFVGDGNGSFWALGETPDSSHFCYSGDSDSISFKSSTYRDSNDTSAYFQFLAENSTKSVAQMELKPTDMGIGQIVKTSGKAVAAYSSIESSTELVASDVDFASLSGKGSYQSIVWENGKRSYPREGFWEGTGRYNSSMEEDCGPEDEVTQDWLSCSLVTPEMPSALDYDEYFGTGSCSTCS